MAEDRPEEPVTTSVIDDHSFEPGDHAREAIGPDHLCHDCGKPLSEHSRVPVWLEESDEPRPEQVATSTSTAAMPIIYDPGTSVTAPLPTPSEGVKTGEPSEPWRPPWWNRTPGPVIYEYDIFDWLIRLLFFALGLLIGFLAWHGVHFSFSI